MERAMTIEEKIRRAEEIYEKRKQGKIKPVAKVTLNNKKDIKLLKKMIIQIIICVFIYVIIQTVQNSQYVFSEDFINRANDILSYDTNFLELYDQIKNKFLSFGDTYVEEETSNNDAIGGAEATQENEAIEALSQEEQDIQNIKNTTSFIKPVEGTISSKYGYRDTETETVPKNHTGTDIAANLGTKIISATDGEVVLASEEGDYRKTFKNSNWRGKYYLCTL